MMYGTAHFNSTDLSSDVFRYRYEIWGNLEAAHKLKESGDHHRLQFSKPLEVLTML